MGYAHAKFLGYLQCLCGPVGGLDGVVVGPAVVSRLRALLDLRLDVFEGRHGLHLVHIVVVYLWLLLLLGLADYLQLSGLPECACGASRFRRVLVLFYRALLVEYAI